MSGTRITIDGLFRCLCPSIDELALVKALRRPAPFLSPLPARTPRSRSDVCTAQWRARPIHTTSRRRHDVTAEAEAHPDNNNPLPNVWKQDAPADDKPATVDDILEAFNPSRVVQRAPTAVIYDTLRAMQTQPKRRAHIRWLVRYLVLKRSQTPNAFLYEALIATNWAPVGSAGEVRQILDEMRELGVATTSSLYHAALRALAVHPDYLLRNRIVSEMRERWLDITPEGRHSICLGLLRDGQHELALDKLEQLLDSPNTPVPYWLLDIFIVVLALHSHLDEAVLLLQRRIQLPPSSPFFSTSRPVSLNIWSLLLDECSRNLHYPGVRLAWDALVPTHHLFPSDGVLLAVLNTASRHGDSRLATEVISLLSSPGRATKLGAHHYEALVDCYARTDDVASALEALCVMASTTRGGGDVKPSQAATAGIFAAFRRNPGLVRVARDAVLNLAERFTVPLAAFNVVLDGLCVYGGDDGAAAFELYQQVRHVCGCGPDYHTFRPFMEGSGWDLEMMRFFVEEMRAFGVVPTRGFYDRLVYVAAVEGDLDTAFGELGELERLTTTTEEKGEGEDKWISKETALALIRKCVAERDERVHLLSVATRVGLDLGPTGQAFVEALDGLREEWAREKEKERTEKEGKTEGGQQEKPEMPPWLGDAFFERTAGGDAGSR